MVERLLAEELLEIRADVIHLGEDEAAIVLHVAHGRDALDRMALLKTGVLVAFAQRDGEQRAVGLERPGVVGAAEELAGIAAGVDGDARALVRTAVIEDVHHPVGVAHHQHRLLADRGAVVVAGIGHLAVMADIDPGVGEQVLHLQVEDLLVDINVAMDLGLPHQVADRRCVRPVLAHAPSPLDRFLPCVSTD